MALLLIRIEFSIAAGVGFVGLFQMAAQAGVVCDNWFC
jgi:Cu/Ag efflux pump CusA